MNMFKSRKSDFRIGHWSWVDIFIYFTVSCIFTEASHLSFIARNVSSTTEG